MKRVVLFFPLLVATLGLVSSPAESQSITLTAPVTSQTRADGEDYFTDVLKNPFDGNDTRDVGWEENISSSSISTAGGVWSGTFSANDGNIYPLFGGFKDGTSAEAPPGDNSLPRFGKNHPLDGTKYSLLSYKATTSNRSSYAVYWANDPNAAQIWPSLNNKAASLDGFYHNFAAYQFSGWTNYVFDMTDLSVFDQRGGTWNNTIYAFRIHPSTGVGSGTTTGFDWVRVVDPTTSPTLNITWSSSGLPSNRGIIVYADNNSSGYDGFPIKVFTSGSDPGSYTLKTATLPPGTYYFYVASISGASPSYSNSVLSNYSASLSIGYQPSLVITQPAMDTGEDYATSVLGNPWDMSDNSDIANLPGSKWAQVWRQFINHSFSGGTFNATAEPPYAGTTTSDVQFHMNVSTTQPIDTSKYRYLTWRVWVDETGYPSLSDKINRGWIARLVWWNGEFTDGTYGHTWDQLLYEGWHTYTVDMWDNNNVQVGYPWKSKPISRYLRIDPLETPQYTNFSVDYVKLTAENRPTAGHYTVNWNLSDTDTGTLTTSLYYDTDKSGYDGTLLTTLASTTAGSKSYDWDLSGLTAGASYYLYATVTDGTTTYRAYSDVPVVNNTYTTLPRVRKTPVDYNGDTISDETFYRITPNTYKINKKSCKRKLVCNNDPYTGKQTCKRKNVCKSKLTRRGTAKFYTQDRTVNWGNPAACPIEGDFDGDGQTDIAAIYKVGSNLSWDILLSFDSTSYKRYQGSKFDVAVVGDYNGDGADDVATFAKGIWSIVYRNGSKATISLGAAGDRPVPGDYDGDGITDAAIFRPTTGEWAILRSSDGQTTNYSFGLAGDYPVPADWDSDGDIDPAVWRPSTGTWYLMDADTQDVTTAQWGGANDIPTPGDYDGNGTIDLSVFRKSAKSWFHHYRGTSIPDEKVTWGGERNDKLPLAGMCQIE